MPFGQHKGKMMIDVPCDYLLWCYEQEWLEEKYPRVHQYVVNNYDVLIKECNDKHNLGAG